MESNVMFESRIVDIDFRFENLHGGQVHRPHSHVTSYKGIQDLFTWILGIYTVDSGF